MFDISISELGMVALVALLVMKPQDIKDTIKSFKRLKNVVQKEYHGHKQKLQDELAEFFEDEIEQGKEGDKTQVSPKRYVVDLQGQLQEAYDLDDIMPFIKQDKQKGQ